MTVIKQQYIPNNGVNEMRINADGNDYEITTQKGDKGDIVLSGSLSGSITVIGEGAVSARRRGNGNGDAICKCTGNGKSDADRTGNGNGDAIRVCGGSGTGWAFRQGNGNGKTVIEGEVDKKANSPHCESRHEGSGNGDAIIRTGKNITGKSVRAGSGNGHAVADGTGMLHAKRFDLGVGGAIHTGKGKGAPERYLDDYGLGNPLAVREKRATGSNAPRIIDEYSKRHKQEIEGKGGRIITSPAV